MNLSERLVREHSMNNFHNFSQNGANSEQFEQYEIRKKCHSSYLRKFIQLEIHFD